MTKDDLHLLYQHRQRAWEAGSQWDLTCDQGAMLMDAARDGFAAQEEAATLRAKLSEAERTLTQIRANWPDIFAALAIANMREAAS